MKSITITDGVTTGRVFSKNIDDNFVESNNRLNSLTGKTSLLNSQIQTVSGVTEILSVKIDTVSGGTSYNTTLDETLTMPTSVGGISAGTAVSELNTKTLIGLMDDILFPTTLPTYTIPTISLTSNVTGIREIGTAISPNLVLTCTENDASIFTNLKIFRNSQQISPTGTTVSTLSNDIAPQFGYVNPNNPNRRYDLSYTDSGYIVPSSTTTSPSTITYNGNASYMSGLPKKNNKGGNDVRPAAIRSTNAPQSASTGFTSSSITINGYYPYYYGKSTVELTPADVVTIIQSGAGFTKVVNSGAGNLSMNFNMNGEWGWFAIFEPFTTKTKWEENQINKGDIGGSNDLFASPQVLPISEVNGYWTNKNFKIYVANKVTTLASCIIS